MGPYIHALGIRYQFDLIVILSIHSTWPRGARNRGNGFALSCRFFASCILAFLKRNIPRSPVDQLSIQYRIRSTASRSMFPSGLKSAVFSISPIPVYDLKVHVVFPARFPTAVMTRRICAAPQRACLPKCCLRAHMASVVECFSSPQRPRNIAQKCHIRVRPWTRDLNAGRRGCQMVSCISNHRFPR